MLPEPAASSVRAGFVAGFFSLPAEISSVMQNVTTTMATTSKPAADRPGRPGLLGRKIGMTQIFDA